MYFVPHFGHAKVYETSIWTPCFQILAKTMGMGGGGGGGVRLNQSREINNLYFSLLPQPCGVLYLCLVLRLK